MSKLSPYRKTANSYLQEYSPIGSYNENKNSEKQKGRRANPAEITNKRYYNGDEYPKLTEKKRYDPISNIDVESLLEKNQALASENAELYMMLDERGKIIVALEKKLEGQVRTQLMTLEAIQIEKGKFIAESHKKFKDYERKIEQLINEIYILNEQKQHGSLINAKEMQLLKMTFNQEQRMHFQSITHNQASARQLSELQQMKMKSLLEGKNNEIVAMSMEFQAQSDKLKNEIISLNNQIVHLSHMKKIQLSEQKMVYESAIDNINKDHNKEKDILIMGYNLQVKKLENFIDSMQNRVSQLDEQKKIGEIQQNNRELQLMENKSKLENEIHEIEEFHRRSTFEETQRLKSLNKNELLAFEVSNVAIVTNLKTENAKLVNLVNTKSQEIDRLFSQLNNLRSQYSSDSAKSEKMIEQLKERMREMERDFVEEEERFKIKYAQLRQADITALKEFYQHQIEVLNKDLYEKTHLANKNRVLLHEELHQKHEMRKNFEIEVLKLNSRIGDLELRLNEKLTQKKEEVQSISDKMQMTSDILLRETKDKEKLNQINEEQKKHLQELILTKDRQIEELNSKIVMITKNHTVEVSHKNVEIELLKKNKDDIEVQLKKEKYFYDNQIKKKDILLKNNKEIYSNDLERLKVYHREQLQASIKESTSKINLLEVELNKYRTLEKNLKNEVNHLHQSKQVEVKTKSTELSLEKERMFNERQESLQKLERYYQGEMMKLNIEISQLKKQLLYKEEDLRSMADKYHRLEQKLQLVIQSQQKLKNMENRIVALGQDNNLVKNIADLMKARSK